MASLSESVYGLNFLQTRDSGSDLSQTIFGQARHVSIAKNFSQLSFAFFLFDRFIQPVPSVLNVSHVAVRSRASNGERATISVRWTEHDDEAWQTRLAPHGARTVAEVTLPAGGPLVAT